MSRIFNGPTGSGVSMFDSAVNEPIRSSLSSDDRNKNDGINEAASDDDDFDESDDADLTQ